MSSALHVRAATSDPQVRSAVAFNFELLRQGAALILQIDDDAYADAGPHVRHCLDFYFCLISGVPARRIDYERRPRDVRVERSRELAVAVARAAMQSLWRLRTDATVAVRTESDSLWAMSSIVRELDAAASHTIHHYAIIAMLLRARGIDVPESFGVSPSTLRFRNGKR